MFRSICFTRQFFENLWLATARLQDGEDYEPLDPDDAVPAASPSNRSLCTTGTPQSINSFMDMHKGDKH